MKFYALFFLSFLPSFLVSMQPGEPLNIWSESDKQEEWQENNYGWTPWDDSSFHNLVHHSRAQNFLHSVSKNYEVIREGIYDDPEFFTPHYLELTSKEHIQIFDHLVLKHFGWPTRAIFDSESLKAIFIIALHANQDVQFQCDALKYFSERTTSNEGRQYCAYLSDRILVNRGQHQYYGTLDDKEGKLFPIQGFNPGQADGQMTEIQLQMVNERRANQSLPPLAREHEKFYEIFGPYKISIGLTASPS